MKLSVRVTPNAQKNKITNWKEGVLFVRLRAAPHDNEANAALIRFIADTFNLAPSTVRIIRGHTARIKHLEVPLNAQEMLKCFGTSSTPPAAHG